MEISLKEHFYSLITSNKNLSEAQDERLEELIKALNKRVELYHNTSRQAQDKFEANVAESFVKTNEFRKSLEDLGKNMATRRELETAITSINFTTKEIGDQVNNLRSKIDVGNPNVATLQSRVDTSSGVRQGEGEVLSKIALILGIVATAITLIIKLL